jgi:Flp pilus assembly protein TadD
MRSTILAAVLAAAALPALHAADTPSVTVQAPPTSAERMAAARRLIDGRDFPRAITELQQVVRAEPNNADAHNLLGYSWRKRSNPDLTKAYEHYYTALRIDPRHKGAHEYIGQAYLMEKRVPQARQHLAELEKICGGTACPEYQELAKAIAVSEAAK